MGNFETLIPQHIKTIEKQIGMVRRQKWSLESEWEHDCNCEYCTEESNLDEAPHEIIMELQDLDKQIEEKRRIIERLKRHGKIHGVNIK